MNKRRKETLFVALLFFLSLLPSFCFADKGVVGWPPESRLRQSAQNAIIAWDGKEEILILSSNLRPTEKSKALEILPLPSEPEPIKEGEISSFRNLAELTNEKLRKDREKLAERGGERASLSSEAEIVLRETVGAHDLEVVRVEEKEAFSAYLEKFRKEKGLKKKEFPPSLEKAVQSYLKRGIRYFAFDLVKLEEEATIQPLLYRFRSPFLYYPLLISGASEIKESEGEVNLFLLLPEGANFPRLPSGPHSPPYSLETGRPWFESFGSPTVLPSTRDLGYPFELRSEELKKVSPDLADFFEGSAEVSHLVLRARLKEVEADLLLPLARTWSRDFWLGHRGGDVRVLQKILINEGVWNSDFEATGVFGTVTREALDRLQEKYYVTMRLGGLKGMAPLRAKQGTGYFGENTSSFLKKLSVGIEKEIGWDRDLARGAEGREVEELQRILKKEKVWRRPYIGPTGYFGPVTERAVRELQEKYSSRILAPLGLSQGTGYVGPSTRSFLNKK